MTLSPPQQSRRPDATDSTRAPSIDARPMRPEPLAETRQPSMPREGRPTVLLVDDDGDVLMSLRSLLEQFGGNLEIRTAHGPSAALDIVDHERVDLIVTDYKMPDMTGLEFWNKVREVAPETRGIMITAFPERAIYEKAEATGFETLVTKPFDPDDLLREIDHALGPEEREPARRYRP